MRGTKYSGSWKVLVVLVVMTSTFTIVSGNKECSCPTRNASHPRTIVIGGSNNWEVNATNYTMWAFRNGPYFDGDVLVFKYNNDHNVVEMPDSESFEKCNVTGAKVLGSTKDGSGEGFKFTLKASLKLYFLACGQANGVHCGLGQMKLPFFVLPRPH
ncbi:cupredoxin superfamily protein [Striga asiatica]|uniref:Cupredoxin superfamily protein n=1 Tax=Striga asiatica TaxID=4170 RepID=A0A5A7P8T2_STRAF|nr:cupredoxin superfamily protein [Striga asiatica]